MHCCCFVQWLRCVWLCNPIDCSTPDSPVLLCLPEFAQTPVHWVGDAIQPSHPLLPPSPPAPVFPSIRVFSSESALLIRYWSFHLQHQSFQWVVRVDFLQDWLVWSPCCPEGLSGVFSGTAIKKHQFQPSWWSLTSIHDYWKNHSFNYMHQKWCLCFLIHC